MIILLVLCLTLPFTLANSCNVRKTEHGFVCVCNSTYCDPTPSVGKVHPGEFKVFSTSKSHVGFNSTEGYFVNTDKMLPNSVKVNKKEKFQTIFGFGGAFTDATGINIKSLPLGAQEKLIESYFGRNGIEYSLCRVPIGGADFSPRPYSYADQPNDFSLKHFKLQEEDLLYKIPFIKSAIALRNRGLKLFASAWTAPPWMKTNNQWTGYGFLKKQFYKTWADYAVRFFKEYSVHGIHFWGMTTGNEPMTGLYSNDYNLINSMGWDPLGMKEWISGFLGPAIRNSSFDLKIIIHDDNRVTVPYFVPGLLQDENSLKFIDGVGIHWYTSTMVPPSVLQDFATSDKKDVFWISTESCYFREGVKIGSWKRAELYITDIFDNLQHGLKGWVDWNMALNLTGGPTYIQYEADSPIIVNAEAQEFYKQPMYYAVGHFSKFVIPDSVRIAVEANFPGNKDVRALAFLRPDDLIALLVFNNGSTSVPFHIEDDTANSANVVMEPYSINTYLYSPQTSVKG